MSSSSLAGYDPPGGANLKSPTRSLARPLALLFALLVVSGVACRSTSPRLADVCPPKPVPSEEAKIHSQQIAWLDAYRRAVEAREPGARSKPGFGGHLLTADSNRAGALLADDALDWAERSLDAFQALGMTGVTLNLGYPLLLPEFPDSARYLSYYRRVAESVRRRGMTLAVEQIVLYTKSRFSPFDFEFGAPSLERYTADQTRMAQIIVDTLAPDFLTILHEPDTVAELTGIASLLEPEVAARHVGAVARRVRRGTTKLGAGSGSWTRPEFVAAFARDANLDYIDIHVYWINEWSIENTYELARLASAGGKAVVFTEVGLYKTVGDGLEGTPHVEGVASVYRRDVFSFWAPLDVEFLELTARLARSVDASYVSAYWTNMLFSYIDWTPGTSPMSYQQLNANLSGQSTAQAWLAGRITCTGEAYREIIRGGGADPE